VRWTLSQLHRELLGRNRRNHEFLFRYNLHSRLSLVDDKRATRQVLERHAVPAPRLLATAERQGEIRGLIHRLHALGEFALKPARGAGGAGIVIVCASVERAFGTTSGRLISDASVAAHICDVLAGAFSLGGRVDALVVEERLVPEPTLAQLSYRGVPDVRVIVFRGVPVQAMLRLPTRRSEGRANLHLGGIGVGVRLDSGQTTSGIWRGRRFDRHPDLDVPLRGAQVPAWQELLALAVRAADAVGLGFVGVDLVVDARRGALVLELNARPGLGIQAANRQGLRPLLATIAAAALPSSIEARVQLGQSLSAG